MDEKWGKRHFKDFESAGRPFEPGRARQKFQWLNCIICKFVFVTLQQLKNIPLLFYISLKGILGYAPFLPKPKKTNPGVFLLEPSSTNELQSA